MYMIVGQRLAACLNGNTTLIMENHMAEEVENNMELGVYREV